MRAPVFGNAPGLGGFVDHGCHLEHGVECVITRDYTAGGRNVGSALVSGEDERALLHAAAVAMTNSPSTDRSADLGMLVGRERCVGGWRGL